MRLRQGGIVRRRRRHVLGRVRDLAVVEREAGHAELALRLHPRIVRALMAVVCHALSSLSGDQYCCAAIVGV